MVEVPRSTIGDVLRRHGLSRLRDRDPPTGIPIRYVRERPGELVHVDVKKLGRIPDGGGHRVHGRAGTPRAHAGYDYVHQAIDDASRVAFSAVFADERGTTCAAFLRQAGAYFARLGVRIERVMTDNAKNYARSHAFRDALHDLGARHLRTRPYRPQTNGKAERLIAVIIAGLGIVNTLTMNVLERVREIGVLRSAGMTRQQVGRIVVVEAGILGLSGAILGVVLGLVVAAFMLAIGGGISLAVAIDPPWLLMGVALIAGVLIAMVAAYYPARVASRMSIVRAVQFE